MLFNYTTKINDAFKNQHHHKIGERVTFELYKHVNITVLNMLGSVTCNLRGTSLQNKKLQQ